jgi:branched-chain amino acid transport system substrate-binding protein
VRAFALAMVMALTVAAAGSASPAAARRVNPTLVIGVDLPMHGPLAGMSADTLAAIRLVVEQAGGTAGAYLVTVQGYDDSTAAAGGWDGPTCTANGHAHVANANEVAVIGTFNSGCAELEVPILDQAAGGPMTMISHANSYPGLLRVWGPGEPEKYYPGGVRNYGRISTSDNYAADAQAVFAHTSLHVKRCFVASDGFLYGNKLVAEFRTAAKVQHVKIVGSGHWSPAAHSYKKLWTKAAKKKPDCVFLGGYADSNGARLIKDKVKVLGSNKKVRLLGPTSFGGYPNIDGLKQAQGMFVTWSDMPNISVLADRGAQVKSFLTAFKAKTGHDVSAYEALYGAAVAQLMLKAIAASDGTRAGVHDQLFGGLSVPADESFVGVKTGIDPATGESMSKQITVTVIRHKVEYLSRTINLP